jgi:CheY-like chemotaxis protein
MFPLRCVLLVDDDPTTLFLQQNLLNRQGVSERIVIAHNGQEAIDIIRAQCTDDFSTCPALILLDMNMPVMDGLEFLAAYRALPKQQQCAKVVFTLTSSLLPHEHERAVEWSVAAFIPKPLKAETLRELLQQHFAGPTQNNEHSVC